MEIYNDKNIRIELKNKNLSQDEALAACYWILTVTGNSKDIPDSFFEDKGLNDEVNYFEDLTTR